MVTPDATVVEWDSAPNRMYDVYWKSNFSGGFIPVATKLYYPQNSYTDEVHRAESSGFYILKVKMQEE